MQLSLTYLPKHFHFDTLRSCVFRRTLAQVAQFWCSDYKVVDLHPAVAMLLKEYVGKRKSGFLFSTRNGKPIGSSNVIRRHLHPALNHTGTHKAGNHAFRRFRNTYLRNRTECPEGLYKYWMGHAGTDMSDLYDKIREDVAFRKEWAEKCGFGFEIPSVVPNVPKTREKTKAAKAA